MEEAFVVADAVIYTGFAIVFVVGVVLGFLIISLIGAS